MTLNFIKETHLAHICTDKGLNGTFVNRMCTRYLFIVGSQKLCQRCSFKLKVMNSKGKGKDSTQHKTKFRESINVIEILCTLSLVFTSQKNSLWTCYKVIIYNKTRYSYIYIYMLPIAGWTDWAEFFCGCYGVAGG